MLKILWTEKESNAKVFQQKRNKKESAIYNKKKYMNILEYNEKNGLGEFDAHRTQ